MAINWYPGHMAKAKRLLQQQLGRVDLVIELCDARLPFSSRNPDLDRMAGGKRRLLLLNKSDLAEPGKTQSWLHFFRQEGLQAFAYNAAAGKAKEALELISRAVQEDVERAADRGVHKTVRAMVVGVPNVGKSTFINRLYGSNIARIGDRPGVTRANQWVKITPYLELLDTPGLLWPRLDDKRAAERLCYIGVIKDEVVDVQMLAIRLAEDLLAASPEKTAERFKLKDIALRGEPLLEAICRGRGFLIKGNQCDTDRGSAVVLDEFRSGKLGRITLETPREKVRLQVQRNSAKAGGASANAED